LFHPRHKKIYLPNLIVYHEDPTRKTPIYRPVVSSIFRKRKEFSFLLFSINYDNNILSLIRNSHKIRSPHRINQAREHQVFREDLTEEPANSSGSRNLWTFRRPSISLCPGIIVQGLPAFPDPMPVGTPSVYGPE
jgi:hypothetical protein